MFSVSSKAFSGLYLGIFQFNFTGKHYKQWTRNVTKLLWCASSFNLCSLPLRYLRMELELFWDNKSTWWSSVLKPHYNCVTYWYPFVLSVFHLQQVAIENGLILVDTKYEFGKTADGTIVLIDEVAFLTWFYNCFLSYAHHTQKLANYVWFYLFGTVTNACRGFG